MDHDKLGLTTAAHHPDSACPGCGCLCDDVELVVDQGRIVEARNACSIGRDWFLRESNAPACTIEGRTAEVERGIARAAEILSNARFPMVTGLEHASVESQRIAVQIARRIGARLETTSDPGRQAYWSAIQDEGAVGCTLGEIRHRADLLVAWRADPVRTHPRHFERYSLDAKGEFTPDGRGDRFLIVVDQAETATAARADRFIRLAPDQEHDALTALRALARGVALDADLVAARTGSTLATWQDMFTRMNDARYGAFLYDPAAGRCAARLRNAAILKLVRDMNEHARFTGSPLGSPGNGAGAEQVALWSTGYPGAVDLARGGPRYFPDDAAGLVDAILVVSGDPGALAAVVPSVVIGDRDFPAMRGATVALGAARLGTEDGGTVFRSDGAPLPVRACLSSQRPATRRLLERIDRAIAEAQASPGGA